MPAESGFDTPPDLPAKRQKLIASLHTAKYRRRHGLALVEGVRSVIAALEAKAALEEIVCTRAGRQALASAHAPPHVPVYVVDDRSMSRLTQVETHQGVVATVRIGDNDLVALPDKVTRAVLLDGVQDPGNVGTVIRSAAWFGVDCVIAGEGTADFYNPKTLRSGMGGHWSVALFRHPDLSQVVDMLKEGGFLVAVARADGSEHVDATRERIALVLGSEAHGVADRIQRRADAAVAIPSPLREGHPGVDSLNVAVAAGILMDRLFGGR